jgi:hypothetical protein
MNYNIIQTLQRFDYDKKKPSKKFVIACACERVGGTKFNLSSIASLFNMIDTPLPRLGKDRSAEHDF